VDFAESVNQSKFLGDLSSTATTKSSWDCQLMSSQ